MTDEPGWGEETVALGRRDPEPEAEKPRRPSRGKRGLPPPPAGSRIAATAALALIVVAISVSTLGGADSNPAPSKPQTRAAEAARRPLVRRHRGPEEAPEPALKRPPKGKLDEERDREPQASGPSHKLAAPPPTEASTEPGPVTPAALPLEEASPPPPSPAPAAPAPTPPSVEFGL